MEIREIDRENYAEIAGLAAEFHMELKSYKGIRSVSGEESGRLELEE